MDLRIKKKHSKLIKTAVTIMMLVIAIWSWLVAVGIVVFFVAGYVFARYVLARYRIFFTIGREGTIQRIDFSGQRSYYILFWTGYVFRVDLKGPHRTKQIRNWDIMPGEDPYWHPFGFLRFYGIWPLYNVFSMKFSWSHWHSNTELKPHENETIYEFYAQQDDYGAQFGIKVGKDGTINFLEDLGGVPFKASVAFPGQIVNPEEAIQAVADYYSLVINNIIEPATKQFSAVFLVEDLYSMTSSNKTAALQKQKGFTEIPAGTDLAGKFWEALKRLTLAQQSNQAVILNVGEPEERIVVFGFALFKRGTTIKLVEPREDYRALTTKVREAEVARDVAQINAEKDLMVAGLEAEAERTKAYKIFTGILAGIYDVDPKKVNDIISKNPELEKMVWDLIAQTTFNQLAQIRERYYRVDIQSAGGGVAGDITGGIAAVVLALKEISNQALTSGSQETKEKPSNKDDSGKKSSKETENARLREKGRRSVGLDN